MRLTDEVHLDIQHLSQTVFHQPRRLRLDPWIGLTWSKARWRCLILDIGLNLPGQRGAQFYNPEYVIQRARSLASWRVSVGWTFRPKNGAQTPN